MMGNRQEIFKDDALMLLATSRLREAFPSLTMKMVIAFCAIMVLMATGSAQMSQPEWGFDRSGQDYHRFQTDDWQVCSSSCASQDQCRAYTYVLPAQPGDDGLCRLKTEPAQRSASYCCISGVRVVAARADMGAAADDLPARYPVELISGEPAPDAD
jgi:PAN domain